MANHEDIVIGYHESDYDFVLKLAEKFRDSGLSVWHSKQGEGGDKTSEAILGCKIFVPVMTELSAVDKSLQEQLSLAYISNSAIYPLSRIRFRFLSPKLSGGTRLMLAKINWCFVFKMEEFDKKTDAIVACMKKDLENIVKTPRPEKEEFARAGYITTHGMAITTIHGLDVGGDGSEFEGLEEKVNLADISKDTSFWDRHFQGKTEAPWTEFRDKFLEDYGPKIAEEFSEDAESRKEFFINLMFKDVFGRNRIIPRLVYDSFNPSGTPHSFFMKMQEYVIAYASLRDVLSMDSGLRISTIQNLGGFSFPAIVSGLADMLKDEDPNIRAVSAIALAHAGKDKPDTVSKLVPLIEDEDRLVRESACLSLGFLRDPRAVSYIVDRWRNDPISTVREAAELALSKMDVEDAKRCMKVTQVLSSEMSALKPQAAA